MSIAEQHDHAERIGYEICEMGRSGLTYTQAVEDPVLSRLMRMSGRAYLERQNRNTQEKSMTTQPNPFSYHMPGIGQVQHTDAVSRCQAVDRFDLEQCRQALQLPNLQRAVTTRLRRRIRQLELEATTGGAA